MIIENNPFFRYAVLLLKETQTLNYEESQQRIIMRLRYMRLRLEKIMFE